MSLPRTPPRGGLAGEPNTDQPPFSGDTPTLEQTDSKHGVDAINSRSIKLPQFWKENPVLWFTYVIINLDQTVLPFVSDIIAAPPAENKYETLKQRIIGSFAETNESKLRKLLRGNELADERPSIFLQRLRNLAGGQCNDAMLRTLFLEQLPDSVRSILAISEVTDLSKLVLQADKIVEMSKASVAQVNVTTQALPAEKVSMSNEFKVMQYRIDALTKQVAELCDIQRSRSRSRGYDEYRRRSRTRSQERRGASKTCYFHWKFGNEAYRCVQPCDWKEPLAKNVNAEN
ncbi:uncharacterized protein LOC105204193 [Solenopsis invicta]|uniref:uncharacterized protein LOC105204193 n=1 Tax=Solenopsis invicta TaxID=13686 RepID=UPI000595E65A|nr:uncharacterized protein LOC105204193 [Solenopsis invicta]